MWTIVSNQWKQQAHTHTTEKRTKKNKKKDNKDDIGKKKIFLENKKGRKKE